MHSYYRAELAALREQRAAKLPPLQRAWGTWLFEFQWDWFVTLTFRIPVHPEQAHKQLLRWLNALEHDPTRNGQHPRLGMWRGTPESGGRPLPHTH